MCRITCILVAFILLSVITLTSCDFPQLHRALPGANGRPGYRLASSYSGTPDENDYPDDMGGDADNRGQDKDMMGSTTQHNDRRVSSANKHRKAMSSDWSQAAVYSLISSVLVGLSGIFPLLVIPLEAGPSLKHGTGSVLLKLLLSFAVGSLLGDVFLHLLPEAWATVESAEDPHWAHTVIGTWVICGVLSFMIIEKMFITDDDDDDEDEEDEKSPEKHVPEEISNTNNSNNNLNKAEENGIKKNGYVNGSLRNRIINGANGFNGTEKLLINGGSTKHDQTEDSKAVKVKQTHNITAEHIKISGYLNLLANCIDNFTHGLAIAGSYLISPKVGFCTTVAILLHEIPHEVGDFAILLRSGFDRWKAAKAQLMTASGGMIGALFALCSESAESAGDRTAAILPFTAGGFIYIALVTVVPDLLKEKSARASLQQIVFILAGIASMLMVTILFE